MWRGSWEGRTEIFIWNCQCTAGISWGKRIYGGTGKWCKRSTTSLLTEDVRPYYRDYICGTEPDEYQSLHITFYDNSSRSYMEVQLRTQKMDDTAEIGPANHLLWERQQDDASQQEDVSPEGNGWIYFVVKAYGAGVWRLGHFPGISKHDLDQVYP